MFCVPEDFRMKDMGRWSSTEKDGNNGAFMFSVGRGSVREIIRVIASDGDGWEHVSVSLENRCPTWDEMCIIKDIFWDDTDCVVQYHPPKSEYINHHPYCLHLWRKIGSEFELPPSYMIGPKS